MPIGSGGGVFSQGFLEVLIEVGSTIIAGSSATDINYLAGGNNSFQSLGYNLIGTSNTAQNANALVQFAVTDQINVIGPLLGPLADNGGATFTHIPLPGSSAINQGAPTAMAGVDGTPMNDQRGSFFERIAKGPIDIGAIEVSVDGDFNDDGLYACADIDALVAAIVGDTYVSRFDLLPRRTTLEELNLSHTQKSLIVACRTLLRFPN